MIPAEELRLRAAGLGVSEDQVVRDHLISHVLHGLSKLERQDFAFFGGTALCRTWCDDSRLSEDIDLLVEDHVQASDALPRLVSQGIRREFPIARWVDMGRRHEVDSKILDVGGGMTVKMQFARWRRDWRVLPVAPTSVRLRYSDLPEQVTLTVPTSSAFIAMKLIAWGDRQAPRDLFDLHELALRGYFTPEVAPLVHGITGYTPTGATLGDRVPRGIERAWRAELGHQLADLPDPSTCLETVRLALEGKPPGR